MTSATNSFSKEMAIRRRISSIFNKREEDYSSLKEYNDYLEEVEDMTFCLIEGRDVLAIEDKIAKYQAENADQIVISRARKAEEYAAALAASKGHTIQTNADEVACEKKNAQVGGTGVVGGYAPSIAVGASGPSQPAPLGISGPHMPSYNAADEEMMTRLRLERGGPAGGWSEEFSRKRALEEAFQTLWV